ncbi:MAG: hypothetical protein MJ249_17135, partial [Kiritimatiellae bacterium]|nr:hypothetical protein [Kiritimatiellia bacterium]
MKKTVISLLSMAFAATLFADTTFPMSVDFAQGAGDLNPALHGAHLIPPIKDHATQDDTDIKALGLYSVRNHDHALLDTNQRVFDLPLVYPLAHLDPTADASYVFPPTDELVNTVTQTIGTDLLYRLGVSTEESGEEHFNAEIPADFGNTAAAMSHIVARYKDKVTYWEIWNNPASTAYWW